MILGLSLRVLKSDSLDPDPAIRIQSRLSRDADYAHCTAGLDQLKQCSRALSHTQWSHSTARSSDPDRDRVQVKWSLDPDPRSTSDPVPRFCVEGPTNID